MSDMYASLDPLRNIELVLPSEQQAVMVMIMTLLEMTKCGGGALKVHVRMSV